MNEVKKDYTINDHRGKEKIIEVCRVCGSKEVHTKQYNHPTMKCIEHLREEIKHLNTTLEMKI